MEITVKIAWALIAALHVAPSLALFAPDLVARLYGVDPAGDVGILITHRAAMFLTVFVVAIIAIFDPTARKIGSLVAALSMIAFLIVYARAGSPPGPLRSIAIADLIGLAPLLLVSYAAWRTSSVH